MKISIISAVFLGLSVCAWAQSEEEEGRKGFVSGGFETNTIYYVEDTQNSSVVPDGSLGSNNYVKVDFGYGKFQGGLQAEGYFPGLQGYPSELKGIALTHKYVQMSDSRFTVRAGDFYEQLGSGLLFRAYEERSLGVNTALMGVYGRYGNDWIGVKAFLGVPKHYLEYNMDSRVAGADLSFSLARLLKWDDINLSFEGSVLNKYQALAVGDDASGCTPTVNGFSARALFGWLGLTLKGEYVRRGADVAMHNGYNTAVANAILAEASYTWEGLGVNLTFRKLDNMSLQSDRYENRMFTLLNYMPSLTQQHEYSLAALNPYVCQTEGEIGGQADVYYFFPRKTKIGGVKGMRVHANFSTYYGPRESAVLTQELGNELYFRDLTVDAERWFGKKFKTILLFTWQTYNNRVGNHPSDEVWNSYTAVADMTFKFNQKHALRCELQHLYNAADRGSWAAGTLEYSIAPAWSFSVTDIWNYGGSKTHYYNGGVSYAHSRSRFSLNFGRFKEGYQCAGGVCRLIPAYTGVNFAVTTSF